MTGYTLASPEMWEVKNSLIPVNLDLLAIMNEFINGYRSDDAIGGGNNSLFNV